jgi:hypothetical protein
VHDSANTIRRAVHGRGKRRGEKGEREIEHTSTRGRRRVGFRRRTQADGDDGNAVRGCVWGVRRVGRVRGRRGQRAVGGDR